MSKSATFLFFFFTVSFMQNGLTNPLSLESKHVVFLVNDNDSLNYMAHQTIPEFATKLQNESNGKFRTTVILGNGTNEAYHFPDLERIQDADLLVVFTRRIALPAQQVNLIKNYINSGKPVLGLRTANHGFSMMSTMTPVPGHIAWNSFVAYVLGCENRGYCAVEWGTNVSTSNLNSTHPVLLGLDKRWHSIGNVYKVAPLLDKDAAILLYGEANGEIQPIAWTRKITETMNTVFYTSLGHPDDFEEKNFNRLLTNAVNWLVELE